MTSIKNDRPLAIYQTIALPQQLRHTTSIWWNNGSVCISTGSSHSKYFYSPHKTLAFNKSLIHNDGLLGSEIVRYTNVSYEAATIAIHQFVRKLENDLSGKGQAVITGVGKFYYDIEHNLLFESSEENNYLTNAFGFDRFVAKPVMRREEVIHQLANEPAKRNRVRVLAGLGLVLCLL